MKIQTVRFCSASPLYGFSAVKVGVANITAIEMHPTLPAVQITRATGQKLLHPLSAIDCIIYEDSVEEEKKVSKSPK